MAKARILFVTDLHKACREMSSIKGRIEATTTIQNDIIKFNRENNITHLVVAGDWYHRGYQNTARTFSDFYEDRMVSQSVNGNVYLCIGNHLYLERDDNPEMYIIQPCDKVRPSGKFTMPEEPLFRVVDDIVVNGVQISFFHFNKVDKTYTNERKDGVKYHIGVYHDDYALPSWVREKEGYVTPSFNGELNRIYSNVDLAVHGHIHTRFDPFKFELNNGRQVSIIVPGSLGITQNKEQMKHQFVQLPVLDIDEDGTVSISFAQFSTHMEMLRFYKAEKKMVAMDVKAKSASDVDEMSIMNSSRLKSLPLYMKSKGLPDNYLTLMEKSISTSIDVTDVIKIIGGK